MEEKKKPSEVLSELLINDDFTKIQQIRNTIKYKRNKIGKWFDNTFVLETEFDKRTTEDLKRIEDVKDYYKKENEKLKKEIKRLEDREYELLGAIR